MAGKFQLYSGPADAQDPTGSTQDKNPFVAKMMASRGKASTPPPAKKKKHSQAQQDAISRRLKGGGIGHPVDTAAVDKKEAALRAGGRGSGRN